MKANSCWKVLETVRAAGLWIDAVSGNEVLRARRAGFAMGAQPPVVMLTADVFRDNALTVGARARRAAQRRLARHDRRAARRRLPRADRRARQPRLRARPRAVVRHRRPVVEARHLARGAGRAARPRAGGGQAADRRAARARRHRPAGARVRRQHAARSSSCSAARLPRFPGRRGGELRRRHPAPLPPGRAGLRPRRLPPAAGRRGGAAGRGGRAPDPRRDRARAAIPSPARRCSSAASRTSSRRRPTPRARGTSSSWSTPASTI